ncbi:DUF3310 domain-containing protein [Streptomyces ardesiacus]|uniref:DUF3310 domain-containing protein n=1 Tax=Streptomyces ardesiacus TaxID=285564 RepID=UPI003813FEE6
MRFSVGDAVVIEEPSTAYTEQFRGARGKVTGIHENEHYSVEVRLSNGQVLGFAEHELDRDDLTPYIEILDEFIGLQKAAAEQYDEVNHPSHYTWLPNGVEVIDITQHFNFTLGNALKYIMRAGHKHDEPLTDLRKAAWYINREIERLENAA